MDERIEQELRELRAEMVRAVYERKTGLLPPSFSVLEILWVLKKRVLTGEDDFVLSKGHAALAEYAIEGKLQEFRNGELPGLTLCGSLGHGLSISLGLALPPRKFGTVYCLLGDGECNEGSVWEAARVIGKEKLPIVAIIDANGTHDAETIGRAFEAFGWELSFADGHDVEDLEQELNGGSLPVCIVAFTKKGKGCKEMEDEPAMWHNRVPNEEEMKRFVKELLGAGHGDA